MATRFERDTAIERLDDHVFGARADIAWWVARGPNGGYLAAIITRALTATVDDATRAPRSLTVHFAAPPEEGAVTITTAIERSGRSLTSCSARMEQGERLIAVAMAAYSSPRPGPEFCDVVVPDVPLPAAIDPMVPDPMAPPIAHRWETRWAVGRRPWSSEPPAREAVAGGWIRLEEPQGFDAPVIAAAEGFLEEDGEVWAPDGTLLAQSRQLATFLPLP